MTTSPSAPATSPIDPMQQTSDPAHRFPVRRIRFDDAIATLQAPIDADNDPLMSHLVAVLSGVFPDGEQMFIDAVKYYRDEITDPDLKEQVNAFIGQEVVHGREHRLLNDKLGLLGYRSKMVEETMADPELETPIVKYAVKFLEKVGILHERDERNEGAGGNQMDPMFQLALTAALEHFTATLAEALLTEDDLQRRFAHDGIFRLFAWHAIEECEHKAVAFDVYRAVGGTEEMRSKAMKTAKVVLVLLAGYHAVAGALQDERHSKLDVVKSVFRLRSNPLFAKKLRTKLNDYHRADFHPLDHDTSGIEQAWRTWLDEDGPRPVAV